VIWYGEEIGMGDDLSLEERNPVRTPMQLSDRRNAGFSEAPPGRLVRPVVSSGPFGYRKVNIAAQRDVPGSMMKHSSAHPHPALLPGNRLGHVRGHGDGGGERARLRA